MPGMNGDELAAAVKALDLNQRIVMITAYPELLAASGTPLVKAIRNHQLRGDVF
jgi:hypothetical protein